MEGGSGVGRGWRRRTEKMIMKRGCKQERDDDKWHKKWHKKGEMEKITS